MIPLWPTEMAPSLSDDDRIRYQRQLLVAGFGESAQQRLRASSALVTRIGGVGGSAAQALALAGVGRLVVAHAGPAQIEDLNRMVLMSQDDLGRSRVEVARRRIRSQAPRVEVEAIDANLDDARALELVARVDVALSCAPTFAERSALNRACVRLQKPLVHAAMFALEGQLLVVRPGVTACLSCVFRGRPPWPEPFPALGAVSNATGCLAAVEAVKILCGLGEPLAGRMLVFDAGTMSFRTVAVARDPACPECGT